MEESKFTVTNIFLAHRFMSPPGWCSTEYEQARTRHGLIYVLEGSAYYEMADGQSFTARKDDLLYMPVGTRYLTKCNDDAFLHMTVNFEMDGSLSLPRHRHCDDGERTQNDITKIVTRWSKRQANYREECIGRLYLLLCDQLEITHRDERGLIEKLRPALDIIGTEYLQELTVSGIAARCGISEAYLRRLFSQVFGMSPLEYMTQMRISYACELLLNTSFSIEELCYQCGYNDPAYFCRVFRKATGMSPTMYRRK